MNWLWGIWGGRNLIRLTSDATGRRDWPTLVLLLMVFLSAISQARAADTNHLSLKISGYGLFGNRELKELLQELQPELGKTKFYDANFIEDSALLLRSTVQRGGYLKPRITARITLDNGEKVDFEWADVDREPLPRPLRAIKLHFKIHEGLLYHYTSVEFTGLKEIPETEALGFFLETAVLIPLNSSRIYTPEKLRSSISNLKESLQRHGLEAATVEVADLRRDDQLGKVWVRIAVHEGPRSIVRSIREELYLESTNRVSQTTLVRTNVIFSPVWVQDFKQALKTNWLHQGYPDTVVDLVPVKRENHGQTNDLDLLAKVTPGAHVLLRKLLFAGYKVTRPSLMQRDVRLTEGEELDRVKVDEGRSRLARLGIFDSVEVKYDLVSEHERDVLYQVREGKRTEVSVLAGWGSYDLLRGGVDIEQFNLFGLAQHARLRLIQSFKSSIADFTYTIPELLGNDVDLFLTGSGLLRKEVSFTREEYGGGVGVRKFFKPIASDLSVRYQYQVLNTLDAQPGVQTEGLTNATVGSIVTEFRQDKRDNPLYPHHGYKIFSDLELGFSALGGNANYQRIGVATSYHFALYRSAWMSLGLSHGVILTVGDVPENMPFNKRFFPGGENSIRGYQEGEASPRNELGEFVGAQSFILGNVEIEQALTQSFSMVVFSDSLGEATNLRDYPSREALFSVGGGLRWRTIVGPVRLEYGYNLNPRPGDPVGTLHFSLGFPF